MMDRDVREEVRTASDVIVDEAVGCLLLTEIFNRVRPKHVAHQALSGWLAETVDLARDDELRNNLKKRSRSTYVTDIIECLEFGRETAVNAEELLVHDGSKRQSTE